MPDETRQPDPEFRWFVEYADGWHRAVETICTIVGVSPALSADESVVAVRERVEAIRQETARATWERAIDFVQQLPRAEAIGVMSGMLDKTYGRTKPISEIRELVTCPACYGSGFVCDADGIEDNCSTCNTTGRVAATPTENQR